MGALTYSLDLSTRYFWRTVGRVLRTDHWLRFGRWQALRLHYRLDRTST
jgi:hypothetical protein